MATPLYIQIGLHYSCCAGDFDRLQAPAVQDALANFVAFGLLEKMDAPDKYGATYRQTDGLRVWCDALCNVPFPTRVWQIQPPAPPADTGDMG